MAQAFVELMNFSISHSQLDIPPLSQLSHPSLSISLSIPMNKHSTFIIRQLFPTLLLSHPLATLILTLQKKLSLSHVRKVHFLPALFSHHLHLYSTSRKRYHPISPQRICWIFHFASIDGIGSRCRHFCHTNNNKTYLSPDYAHLWMHFWNVLHT